MKKTLVGVARLAVRLCGVVVIQTSPTAGAHGVVIIGVCGPLISFVAVDQNPEANRAETYALAH